MSLQLIGNSLEWVIGGGLTLAGILTILIWKRDKTKRVSDMRIFLRVVAMIGMYFLFASTAWLLAVLIIIIAATLFFGRFFCGFVCPFGLYMDIVTMVREKIRKGYRRLPENINRALHLARYPILIFFLVVPFFLSAFSSMGWPFALYFTGPFKPWTVLLAPLEPLVVPWGTGPIGFPQYSTSISYPYLSEIKYYSPADFVLPLLLFFVVITLATSFVTRRFWCRFCPTGASIAIVSKFRGFKWVPILHINKVEEKCTKCGICKRVCPVQVLDVYEKKGGDIKTAMCMHCFRCVEMCPYEGCLKVNMAGKTVFQSRNWLEPSKSE
jgi:ferredoxin-type protein NapH